MCNMTDEHDGELTFDIGVLWQQDAGGNWVDTTLWLDTLRDLILEDEDNDLGLTLEEAEALIAAGQAAYDAAHPHS